MGHMLIEAVHAATDDCALAGALDREGSPALGQDATAFLGRSSGVTATSDLRSGLKDARFLIDFTRPEGTMAHLTVCRELGVKMVIGTTGFSDAQKAEIAAASKDIAIMMAPNMSVGVNVVMKLLEMAAKALSTGLRHRDRRSAPPPQGRCTVSGTALKMGEVVAGALGRDLKDCAVYAREGVTGERDPSTIGFATIRGGDIVGDHTVLFAGHR
jgi:4-hydroxy-tetrahydrodipicolinate reductase